jgi:hypothetical protein
MLLRTCMAALAFVLLATAPANAFGPDPVLLYDADFNGFTAGSPVPEDDGPYPRNAPSHTALHYASLPYVVSSALGLEDQPILIESDPGSCCEQVIFEAGELFVSSLGAPIYRVDVDLSVTGATIDGFIDNDFTLFLDLPSIFPISFGANGHGELYANEFDYPEGVPFHLTAIVDFSQREWQVTIGETILAGLLDYSEWTDLKSVRFSVRSSPVVALDNFQLWAIPEPGTGALVLLGLLAFGVRRR